MSRITKILALSCCALLWSCVGSRVGGKNTGQQVVVQEVDEDLSPYQDTWLTKSNTVVTETNSTALSENDLRVNKQVEQALERTHAANKGIKYANGYRVQVYVGKERKVADEAKIYVYQNFPNINPYLTFSLPFYKLVIGDFLTKADADKVLDSIKNMYPEAILVPAKIDIRKSFLGEN